MPKVSVNRRRLREYREHLNLSRAGMGLRSKDFRTNADGQHTAIHPTQIRRWEEGITLTWEEKNAEALAKGVEKELKERGEKADWEQIKEELTSKDPLEELIIYLKSELNEIHYQKRTLKSVQSQRDPFSQRPQEEKMWTVKQMLESGRNFVITGEPGIGKSTLLDEIALFSAENSKIPVYVNLQAGFCENFENFKTVIWAAALSYKAQPQLKIPKDDLKDRSFTFLLDHLDMAVPLTEEKLPPEIGFINTLASERSERDDKFIVCCRANFDHYYDRLDNSRFKRFNLLELDVETNVSELLSKNGITELHSNVEKNRKLLEFAKNPYRLKMLVDIYKSKGEVGIEREVEIYEQFVDLHLKEEESKWKAEESPYVKKASLAWLAYEVLTSDDPDARKFRRSWARAMLRRNIIPKVVKDATPKDIEIVIREILAEGLIVLSPDEARFEFSHPSLSDFFCAWHLFKNFEKDQALDVILKKVGDPEKTLDPIWKKVIVFYAGVIDDATALISMLGEGIFASKILLRVECVQAARCVDQEIRTNIFKDALNIHAARLIGIPQEPFDGNLFFEFLQNCDSVRILASIADDHIIDWSARGLTIGQGNDLLSKSWDRLTQRGQRDI